MKTDTRSEKFNARRRETAEKRSWKWIDLDVIGGPSLSEEEAFLAILIGAVRADGHVNPKEAQELAALTQRTRTLAELRVGQISEMSRKIEEKIDRQTLKTVLGAACRTILNSKGDDEPSRRAESVFAHAVDLVFLDNEVNDLEIAYLEELSTQLKLDEARVKQIVSVIEVKNAF